MRLRGFTVVELVVVISVIGILATIAVFGFGTWRTRTAETTVKSDIMAASTKMKDYRNWKNSYPIATDFAQEFTPSPKINMSYAPRPDGASYCLRAQSASVTTVVYYYDSLIGGEPTTTACS